MSGMMDVCFICDTAWIGQSHSNQLVPLCKTQMLDTVIPTPAVWGWNLDSKD